MKPLSLRLLGGLELRAGREMRAITARKSKALLAYLGCHLGEAVSRDRLAGLLWEDSSDAQARGSLRQSLTELRRALGEHEDTLEATTDAVRLEPSEFDCDVPAFEARVSALGEPEALREGVALYRGDLLDGFTSRAPAFEEWAGAERERLSMLARRALSALLDDARRSSAHEAGVAIGRQLLRIDPLSEAAHRAVMEMLDALGRGGEAIRQYRACERVLRRELNLRPATETEALHRRILSARRRSATQPATREPAAARTAVQDDAPPRTELRHAVIVALRTTNLAELARGADPEALSASANAWREVARREVERFAGVVTQSSDESTVAVFGARRARGDELAAGVSAALELEGELRALEGGATFGIAVTLGQVIVRDSERALEVAGAALVEAIELARSARAWQIIAPLELASTLAERLEREPLPEARADGAVRVLDLKESARQTAFVGRRLEKEQLRAALLACRDSGAGQTILIRGEAGMGKTRLIGELIRLAQAEGFGAARANVLDFGGERRPLVTMARALLGVPAQARADRFDAGRLQALGLTEDDLPILLEALDLPMPEPVRRTWQGLTPPSVAALRRRTVERLLRQGSASRPLLLVVEDIHWADEETLATVAEIAAATNDKSVLLIASTRVEGEPSDPAWRAAMLEAPLLTLDLSPLRDAEAAQLGHLLSNDELLIENCLVRAGGNPFFLEQLLRMGIAGGGVPATVHALVQARLDRLAAPDRDAAQAAAVLGQEFQREALEHLLDQPGFYPLPLLEQRLLRASAAGLRFAHALIREATYSTLLKSRRSALHLRAAEWFRDRDAKRHAEHLVAAESPEAAAACLEQAVRERRSHRLTRSVAVASAGLPLARTARDRFELSIVLGIVQGESGAIAAALASFDEADRNATNDFDRARAALGRASALGNLDRHREAIAALDAVGDIVDDQPLRLQSDLAATRGNLLFTLGALDECARAHGHARSLALRAGSTLREARAESGLGDAEYARGRMIDAAAHYARCVELCEQRGFEPAVLAANLAMVGLTDIYRLAIGSGMAAAERALEVAMQYGHRRAEALALNVLSLGHLYRDDIDAAGRLALRGVALSRELGTRRFEADDLAMLAYARHLQGDLAGAHEAAAQGLAIARDGLLAFAGASVLGVYAAVDPQHRTEHLAEGEAILRAGALSHCHLLFYYCVIEASLDGGEHERALRYADALLAYGGEELPYCDFLAARARAVVAQQRGDGDANELAALAARANDSGFLRALRHLTPR